MLRELTQATLDRVGEILHIEENSAASGGFPDSCCERIGRGIRIDYQRFVAGGQDQSHYQR